MAEDRPTKDQPTGASRKKTSLLGPESIGGKTALDGFDFQRHYALILLIRSLQDPVF